MGFNTIWGTLGFLFARVGDQATWIWYFGYVMDECLILVDNLKSMKGSIVYCLFGTEIDEYFTDFMDKNGKWYKNSKVIMLCHKYEYKSLSIIFEDDHYYERIKEFILKKSCVTKSSILKEISDSNRYSFGKLYIHLQGIPLVTFS